MASDTTYAKCACENCGGRIEFPAEAAGQKIDCPHCQFPTILTPPAPAPAPKAPGGNKALLGAAILGLVICGAAAWWWVGLGNPAANPEANPSAPEIAPAPVAQPAAPPQPPPNPWHGLRAGPLRLENGVGSLVYVVGQLRNVSDHQRFGVKVTFDLFDANGTRLGSATDYTEMIDVGKEWEFHALVTDRGATRAELVNVTEQ